MSSDFNRRDFMKAASLGAGVMVAAGYNPRTYAQNEKVRVGCIGVGGQGTYHIKDGMAGTEDIVIVAVADCFRLHQKPAAIYGQISNAKVQLTHGVEPKDLPADLKAKAKEGHKPNLYYDYKEMLAKEELDAVVISTPLHTHYDIVMDCLNAGKYVFCEKTLAYTIEDSRKIVTKCCETGKFVQVGHQRRYNPKYNLGMHIAYQQGLLGRINHITAQWHRNTNWRRPPLENYELDDQEKLFIPDLERHWNWRMYEVSSGGLFTELATHQTDIANWFMQGVPTRVYASGGLDYWRDDREVDDNIMIAYDYVKRPGEDGFWTMERRSELQSLPRINSKPYTVRFEYSSILTNAKRGASEMIHGDYGTLELTEDKCFMYGEASALAAREARMKAEAEKNKPVNAEEAAAAVMSGKSLGMSNKEIKEGKELLGDKIVESADTYQFRAFAHHIKNGGVPRSNQVVGLTTAITAIAALESRKTGNPVDVDPAWYTFDCEVPGFHDYHWEDVYPAKPEGMEETTTEAGERA